MGIVLWSGGNRFWFPVQRFMVSAVTLSKTFQDLIVTGARWKFFDDDDDDKAEKWKPEEV